MNQRMMVGALVLLIAAAGVIPKTSPAVAALAGTLVLSEPESNRRLTLVLRKDGSAILTTETPAEKTVTATQSGLWTVDNDLVKLALTASSGASPRQMTLSIQEDSLVVINADSQGPENGTFRRQ